MPKLDGPSNLFRLAEAGELDYVEAAEPEEDIPGRLEPAFGCRPYGRDREGATRTVTVALPTGEVVTGDVCDTCGSGARRDGRDFLGRDQHCEACGRSHRDGEIAALRARP